MIIRRLLKPPRYCRPADGDGGDLGGAPAPAAIEAPSPAPAPAEPPAAAPAAAPAAPASMHEAMWHRDELGRFASPAEKAAAEAAAAGAPAAPAAKPAEAPKPPVDPNAPVDDLAMPEGLGQKAQERFQKLAGSVRELTEKAQTLESQVSYVRDTFQSHGITQQQFEQAAGFIGAINRGDYAAAEQALLGQLQQLSLLTGKTYGSAVDPLKDFPDLRQNVDQLHMTEAAAIETARLRMLHGQRQQQDQQQRQQIEQQNSQRQAVQSAQTAIDTWWKQTAATDLDAPAIEAQLLPHIPALLQGVPPSAWVGVIQAQYKILKGAAGQFRQHSQAGSPAAPLRPTGSGASPQQRPQSMYEAMWNRPA